MISLLTTAAERGRRSSRNPIAAAISRATAKLRLVCEAGIERIDCELYAVISHQPGERPTLLAMLPGHDLENIAHLLIDAAPCELARVRVEIEGQGSRRGR